jgi:hypothetical protein
MAVSSQPHLDIFPFFSANAEILTSDTVFTKEELIELYGNDNPSISEKTRYWMERWDEWGYNEVIINLTFDGTNKTLMKSSIKRTDYVMRYVRNAIAVRFRNRDDMMWFKLIKDE